MKLTCVLFNLETNAYIPNYAVDTNGKLAELEDISLCKDFTLALHFNDKQEARKFLSDNEQWIVAKTKCTKFTPREYDILEYVTSEEI